MDLFLTFLGTAASVPTAARGLSATLLTRGGDRILVDCGEGTQRQLLRSRQGLIDLDVVLLTHLHGDHYLGLPGLLKTFALRGRGRPLPLVGPKGLSRLMRTLEPVIGRLSFPVEVVESDGGAVCELEGAAIEAFPTRHSVVSIGYSLVEEDRPGSFDVAAAQRLGVPSGPLFGRLQRGEEVLLDDGTTVRPEQVLGDARRGRRVVMTGDTGPCQTTLDAAWGATVLVHEATFSEEDRDRARETDHSTAAEAAALAEEAGVTLLALTHLGARAMPREIRREAEEVFRRTVVVPRDFDRIEVPNPERGAPVVHRWRGPEGRAAEGGGTLPGHGL